MNNTISRRSLAKGVAWSVPAVVAAGSVPALAVSPSRDCAAGPYLQVRQREEVIEDEVLIDQSMTGFTDPTGNPLQIGEYASPRDADLFRTHLKLITTGELAAGSQIIMNLQWEQTDTWYVENPEDEAQPLERQKITTAMPAGNLTVAKGALYTQEPEPLTPLTEVAVFSSPGGRTSRMISFTLDDTVATEREIMLVLTLPSNPVEPGEMESVPGYDATRDIVLTYNAVAVDNSGCTYAATSGYWQTPISGS